MPCCAIVQGSDARRHAGAQADLPLEPVEEPLLQSTIDLGEGPELRQGRGPSQADAEVGRRRHVPGERRLKAIGPILTCAVVGEPVGWQRRIAQSASRSPRATAARRKAAGSGTNLEPVISTMKPRSRSARRRCAGQRSWQASTRTSTRSGADAAICAATLRDGPARPVLEVSRTCSSTPRPVAARARRA